MHTCSQFLQIIPPAYTPAIRRLWKNPPDHFWKIPAGHPLEKLAWPLLENITTNACKSYQESTPTKHFVCLAVLSARSLSRPNLNQSLQKAGITNCEYLPAKNKHHKLLNMARPGATRICALAQVPVLKPPVPASLMRLPAKNSTLSQTKFKSFCVS